jgi:hypothetical protein
MWQDDLTFMAILEEVYGCSCVVKNFVTGDCYIELVPNILWSYNGV